MDNQILLRRTIAHAANRGGIAIIEPRRDANVTLVGRMTVAHVETDPADMVEMRLGPAVRRILMRAVVHHQIARDIARRMPEMAHRGDEYMRMVLTHPAFAGERLLGARLGIGDTDPVRQSAQDQRRQRVRALDVVGEIAAEFGGQRAHPTSRARQRGRAEKGPERHRAAVRADHPVPSDQFDFARAADDEFARTAVDRNQIDAIAMMVGIMKLVPAALDRDRPAVDQLLPRPLFRGQLDLLQRIANRAVILIMGAMFDAQSHVRVRTQFQRRRGVQMANSSGRKTRREGWLPFQAAFGPRWKPFGRPEGI